MSFSHDDRADSNSFNENMSAENDDQSLYFKPLGLQSFGNKRDSKLTFEGAAEAYWDLLIKPLQR